MKKWAKIYIRPFSNLKWETHFFFFMENFLWKKKKIFLKSENFHLEMHFSVTKVKRVCFFPFGKFSNHFFFFFEHD